jgi:hypothetical protein
VTTVSVAARAGWGRFASSDFSYKSFSEKADQWDFGKFCFHAIQRLCLSLARYEAPTETTLFFAFKHIAF